MADKRVTIVLGQGIDTSDVDTICRLLMLSPCVREATWNDHRYYSKDIAGHIFTTLSVVYRDEEAGISDPIALMFAARKKANMIPVYKDDDEEAGK